MKLALAFCTTVLSTYVAQPSFAATIYVAYWGGGTNNSGVGEYDSATGAAINANFITGLADASGLALFGNTLFVANSAANNSVGEYNATTGAVINADIMSANDPNGLLISGNTLYVTNFDIGVPGGGAIGTYNATTGAINSNFITGLSGDNQLALSGNILYVAGTSWVGEYDATTGAVINPDFIAASGSLPGLGYLSGLVLSGNTLFAADITVPASCQGACPSGFVGEYNATTGAAINGSLITGLGDPKEIALMGNNLFVVSYISGTVGEYDATTGATINASFITGLAYPTSMLIASTPEPSTWFTFALGCIALFGAGLRRSGFFSQSLPPAVKQNSAFYSLPAHRETATRPQACPLDPKVMLARLR